MRDEAGALAWIDALARHAVGTLDLPLLLRLYRAWRADDRAAVLRWSAQLIAARETAELRAEERQLGHALARVLVALDLQEAQPWQPHAVGGQGDAPAFATLFALAAVRWGIAEIDTLAGYLWAWSENQALVAVRLVPLGQSAGQRMLQRLADAMPQVLERALTLPDEAIGTSAVGQLLASALHETQYSRLFRS